MNVTVHGNTGKLRAFGMRLRAAVKSSVYVAAALGAAATVLMVTRTQKGLDVDGRQFRAYSTKPVWIGGEYASLARGAGGRSTYLPSHAQAGRYTGQMRSKKKGVRFIRFTGNAESGTLRETRSQTQGFKGQRRTSVMKTTAFPNYGAFKSGMGHPITPDGQVSGKMLGGMGQPVPFGATETGDNYVAIGFYDPIQKRKAEGFNNLREWWGVGRTKEEHDKLQAVVDAALVEQIRAIMRGEAPIEAATGGQK